MRFLAGGRLLCLVAFAMMLAACAGRDPHPVAVVQPQDAQSDCAMIRAEIEANNVQAEKLAEENHAKIAQNVAAGVVGVVVWPVWFAMDAKGAAGTEMDALKARQEYLEPCAAALHATGCAPATSASSRAATASPGARRAATRPSRMAMSARPAPSALTTVPPRKSRSNMISAPSSISQNRRSASRLRKYAQTIA